MIPSVINWRPMRPTVTCPHCHRRGAVQRRMGVKPFVEHRCPGPFTLASVEKDDNVVAAAFRITIYATPGVGLGGNWTAWEEWNE